MRDGKRTVIVQVSHIGVEPDLTLLIDMEPRAALTRAKARATAEERFEDFGLDLQVRMREGFLSLAREFPDRFRVIDGDTSPEAVAQEVDAALQAPA